MNRQDWPLGAACSRGSCCHFLPAAIVPRRWIPKYFPATDRYSWRRRRGWVRERGVKLRRRELQIRAPFGLRIEAERRDGQRISAGVGVCQIENVLSREQALICVSWIADSVELVTYSKRSCQSSRQVR